MSPTFHLAVAQPGSRLFFNGHSSCPRKVDAWLTTPAVSASWKRCLQIRAAANDSLNDKTGAAINVKESSQEATDGLDNEAARPVTRRQQADSTDWIASSLTRRFGIGAGLAWVGFLAFGVISEQIKTRTEVYNEEKETRDVEIVQDVRTPEGIVYADLRIGGGASPFKGDLVLLGLTGKVAGSGSYFIDTAAQGNRDVVYAFGRKPYVKGICEGLEKAITGMKAGGRRKVLVPSELGFGKEGADFGDGNVVQGDSNLEYVVELKRVSIAPS